MAFIPAARLIRIGTVVWMLSATIGPAQAAVDGRATPAAFLVAEDASAQLFDFNIPAQPLPAALSQFARVTGRSALFPSTLVTEPVSAPLTGRYTPRLALHLLLAGTGLDVQEISSGGTVALVLTPVDTQTTEAARAAAVSMNTDPLLGYDSLVQQRVWEAICSHPETAQSSYRTVLRFEVNPTGHIDHPRLLRSTGDGRRDAALLDLLQHVRTDHAPPPDMAQPLTMLILPEQAGGPDCATASAAAGSR